MKTIKLFVFAALLAAPAGLSAGAYVMVANSGAGLGASMSKDDAGKIIGGQKSGFTLVVLKDKGKMKEFFGEIGFTGDFNNIWLEKALSGAGKAPVEKDGADGVIAEVKKQSKGVGIIPDADKGKAAGLTVIAIN